MSRHRPSAGRIRAVIGNRFGRVVAVLLVLTAATTFGSAATPSAGGATTRAPGRSASSITSANGQRVPVYAYFYQWFTHSSWRRAKMDFPLAGRYTSDDPHVLRRQIATAQGAGVNGFLTSWKSTPTLDRRLSLLLDIARERRFDVGVVYEALDFARDPLPVATVRADMLHLVGRWASKLRSSYYRKPLIIWTGTDKYSVADVSAVRAALGSRAYLLAASKSVSGYERVAAHVDGEAYYWSSANPRTPETSRKLGEISAAVHAHHGIWIAPATCGFDGTTLGHTRVIDRRGGATLVRSLDDAYASRPDGIGVISWNEWSENTYIEPGERYGGQELATLRHYLLGEAPPDPVRAAAPARGTWSGRRAALLLFVVTAIGVAALSVSGNRSKRRHQALRNVPQHAVRARADPVGDTAALTADRRR